MHVNPANLAKHSLYSTRHGAGVQIGKKRIICIAMDSLLILTAAARWVVNKRKYWCYALS